MDKKFKILYICGSNSCRSIMAEFITNNIFDNIIADSAGITKSEINPYAKVVLSEIGIDPNLAQSKSLVEVSTKDYDYVIALCDKKELNCPVFSQDIKFINKPIDGPSKWAKTKLNEQEKINCYRKTRDEISIFINGLEKFFNLESSLTQKSK